MCSTKGDDHCSFHRVVQNSHFEKVLLMNFSTYSSLLIPFSFPDFLLIGDHEHSTLGKDLVIALFVRWFKTTTLGKSN